MPPIPARISASVCTRGPARITGSKRFMARRRQTRRIAFTPATAVSGRSSVDRKFSMISGGASDRAERSAIEPRLSGCRRQTPAVKPASLVRRIAGAVVGQRIEHGTGDRASPSTRSLLTKAFTSAGGMVSGPRRNAAYSQRHPDRAEQAVAACSFRVTVFCT